MSEYPIGMVGVVKVSRRDTGRRGFRNNTGGWSIEGGGYVYNGDVYDIRPLVVLDPESPAVREFMDAHEAGSPPKLCDSQPVVDLIAQQTKPPRIPEPGLWGVVEAASKTYGQVGHYLNTGDGKWKGTGFSGYARWDELIDPVLIREGVQS